MSLWPDQSQSGGPAGWIGSAWPSHSLQPVFWARLGLAIGQMPAQAAPQLLAQSLPQAPSPGANSRSQSIPSLGRFWPRPSHHHPYRTSKWGHGQAPQGALNRAHQPGSHMCTHTHAACRGEGPAYLKIQIPKQGFQIPWVPPTLGPQQRLESGTRCSHPLSWSPGKVAPRAGSLATALAVARPSP